MDNYIEKIRSESPTLQSKTFLNHASRGPLHGITKEALFNYANFWQEFNFEEAITIGEKSRESFAKLIKAKKEEVTYTANVTTGTTIALNCLDYEKNCNIVCYWNDYVSQVYSALHLSKMKGVEYRPVIDENGIITPEFFSEKIDKNTKMVLLSHVQWLTGFRADIKEIVKIAHENDAKVVVDTIQSTGALVNDVKEWDVDFLSCGVAKWLLGPSQAGFLYMKEEYIDQFYPPFVGYFGVDMGNKDAPYWDTKTLEYLPQITKFSNTNPVELLYYIAYHGMKIILDYGIEKVEKRVLSLSKYLKEELEKINLTDFQAALTDDNMSGIINIKMDNAFDKTKLLSKQDIVVSSRLDGIRISPHFYNTHEDIDKVITAIKEIC